MTLIYQAADPLEAGILKDYLAVHGIAVDILGDLAWGGRGELAVDAYPRLHLRDPGDETRARDLLRRYEANAGNRAQWRCGCGEWVPTSFECCWACGSDR